MRCRNRLLSLLLLAALLLGMAQPVAAQDAAEAPGADNSGFADNNGVQIYYEVEGEGPPLVLVHWASGSTLDWRMFGYVDALKDDYRLILIDMRGHGKSDKPIDPAAYAAEIQAADIVAVLDELGIDKANFFGYSLGGRLGWALAKYAPERFHSLIIGGHVPAVWDDSGWTAWMFGQGADGWAGGLEEFARSLDQWNPEIYPTYVADNFGAIAMASFGLNSEDLSGNLPDVQIPILLLVGENDDMAADMETASTQLPNATMAVLPEMDHGQVYLMTDKTLPAITEFLASVNTQTATMPAALDDATVAKIEAMVEAMMAENAIPGYALGIVKDGAIVYTKGFGVERIGEDRPVTEHTVFGTGSTGKTATAIAVMQLVEAGKIDLDAPVTEYLPYFKLADERYKDITVRLLLEHRSGLPADPEDWFPLPVAYDDGAIEREVRSMDSLELLHAPDEQWSYSSLGMVVLGDIVQKVSGQTFEKYLQETIIDPLGMSDTMLIIPESDHSKLAGNHVRNEDGEVVVSDIFPYRRQFTPTGPLYSSITDLARFAAANLNRGEFEGSRILPEATYEDMWQPVSKMTWDLGPIMNQTLVDYGMTWMLGAIDGHRIASFGGMDEGFAGDLLLAPDDGLAVVMAANYYDFDEFNSAPWETATEVIQILLGTEEEMAGSAPEPQVRLDADTAAAIDTMIEETLARTDVPGLAIAVVKDGEVAYAKGYGTTSLEGGTPVTDQTVFQWCETSMALTTMAVMKLADEGKLDLDKPIVDYVPYFHLADERYKEITTGQILAQVAGIPDSGAAMADWETFMPQYDGAALERWVRNDLAAKGLLFAPGEGWEYSDLAFALLGSVIEAASGQPYEAYMTEHFFAPLGMEKSTFLLEEVDKTLLASPHVRDAEGVTAVTKAQPYHRPFAAANNLFANVADMAKLAQFSLNRGELNGVRILPESAFDTMWTATTPTPFADFPFGRIHPSMLMLEWGNGWFLGDIAGHPAPNTGGGEHGYLAQMFLVPDANLGVVAVGNRLATDEYYAADIAADVLGMLLEK